ncbi:helix-turn-helix domain-containing protein [Streptomyces sp. STCH 565 A]|uniref:helix-turn-helix domain-containing protein n=1 Tax=Streptomyces sp. STCH 565 A TaxID=2950532 RepID=UPI002074B29C|nr:helix-turn-helix domain-containing protein [Streptomyces sp. STCH 565 A]MCM8548837.1 helix-turn-helix domain-containing protein [Streptomyces sp. STCH 565 A]
MPVSLAKPTDRVVPDVLFLSEIAREIGVTRATVTNWHQRHEDFPQVHAIGGQKYVSRSDLFAWLDKDNRWEKIRRAQTRDLSERKPRVRKDPAEIRRLIAKHEAALLRLNRELQRALRDECV